MAVGDKQFVLMESQLGAANGPAQLNSNSVLPILQGGVEAENTQLALANLGAGVRPSVLDNGDFRANYIVNQTGVTTLSSGGKFNDRWSLYASGTVTIVSDGIQMQNVVDFGTQLELYRIKPENPYTFSVFTSDGKCGWATIVFQDSVGDQHVVALGDTGVTLNAIYNWGGGTVLIAFQGTQTISVAKGELGENQTLAYQDTNGTWKLLPQPDSNYSVQLIKCLLYFERKYMGNYRPCGNGYVASLSTAYIYIPCALKRIAPTVSLNGNFQIIYNGTFVDVTYVTSQTTQDGVVLEFSANFSEANVPCSLVSINYATIDINANL